MKKIACFFCFFLFTISLGDEGHSDSYEIPSQQEQEPDEDKNEVRSISINICVTNIHDARSNNTVEASQNQEKNTQEDPKEQEKKHTSRYENNISIAQYIFSSPAQNMYRIAKNSGYL